MIKKTIKYVLILVLLVGSLIWGAGSIFALSHAHRRENVCRAPFTMWALTWPLWYVMPEPGLVFMFRESVKFCPNGRMLLTDPDNLVEQPKTDDTP